MLKEILLTASLMAIPISTSISEPYTEKTEQVRIINEFKPMIFDKEASLKRLVERFNIDTLTVSIHDNTMYGRKLKAFKSFLDQNNIETDSLFENFLIYKNLKNKFTYRNDFVKNLKGDALYNWYRIAYNLDSLKKDIPLFMEQNKEILDSIEQVTNVKKEIVAAIHGMESRFWSYTGDYQALNVFASLYVTGYSTKALYRAQCLFNYAEENNLNITNINSSYAGAIGLCQFMPQNLETLAIGNVFEPEDALKSTANFLKQHFSNNEKKMIFSYNHSDLYVKAVLELAGAATKKTKMVSDTSGIAKRF